jgi:uncharacterized membrane protein (DUF4010 family)
VIEDHHRKSLIATTLLGALAIVQPLAAGGSAVLIAIVLAARDPLHRFVGQTVTAGEVTDVLLIAEATPIILPMLPDRQMGPFGALNPHSIWLVVIMIPGINALGEVATRLLGAKLGVPVWALHPVSFPARQRSRWAHGSAPIRAR